MALHFAIYNVCARFCTREKVRNKNIPTKRGTSIGHIVFKLAFSQFTPNIRFFFTEKVSFKIKIPFGEPIFNFYFDTGAFRVCEKPF